MCKGSSEVSGNSSSSFPMFSLGHSQALSFPSPNSDHFNVCNDQKSLPTILFFHFAYSYNRISGYDIMHTNLLVVFFFKFQIEQLKLRFKNCFAMSCFLESRFIRLDNKLLNRTSVKWHVKTLGAFKSSAEVLTKNLSASPQSRASFIPSHSFLRL